MRGLKLHLIAVAVVACFGASVALACGLDFGWELLNNRAATLDTMPINNTFAFEVARLAPPPKDDLHAVEPEFTNGETGAGTLADALTQAERTGLSSTEADTLQQMRAETSGDNAYDKGKLLPASVRLYTAGAVDFRRGDTNKAISRFEKILDLPANDRGDRGVWAAYMLGRLYGAKGMLARASKSFALTRDFVSEGVPDPLGLAVASYGEEARLHLDRARGLRKSKKKSAKQREEYGHEIASAVALYAAQAAHGSRIGIDSSRIVADEVLGDDAAIEASICDPMVQLLLVDRLLANYAGPPELAGDSGSSGNSQLSQVASGAEKCGDGSLADADQLAAIAYRSGDYHLAQRLVAHATGPLALWVQARLAMQQGHIAEAARYYAEASKAFPTSTGADSADAGVKALLAGQNSVLTLARGEYVDALEQLYPYAATFWGDVTHIAERVLTVDELKTFVDTHKDTQVQPEVSLANLPSPLGFGLEDSDYGSTDALARFWFGDGRGPADHLRDLLARRLVRAGRYREALNYVPALAAESSAAAEPPADPIAEYVQALNDASTARSDIDRARGLYRAAVLAGKFKSGNKIMGTEGPPDSYAEPELGEGTGQFALRADDRFVTDGERQRFKASAPKPDFRYHYIFVGTDEAIHAADLLPSRSQAFAAVLCHAARWMIDGKSCPAGASSLRDSTTAYASTIASIANPLTLDGLWPDEDTARNNLTCQLYQRYLKEGAVVPWAKRFGRDCPEPDFESAVSFTQTQAIRKAQRHERMIHHRWIVLLKLALILTALIASTWWFVRHRYT